MKSSRARETKGDVWLDNKSIYADDVDPFAFADALNGLPKAQSISTMSVRDNVLAGLRLSGVDPSEPRHACRRSARASSASGKK